MQENIFFATLLSLVEAGDYFVSYCLDNNEF